MVCEQLFFSDYAVVTSLIPLVHRTTADEVKSK